MYTKLFHSILDSTIWSESSETKIVWITMLAMSDQHGEVAATIPGLARRAVVSIEDCEKALEKLKSPDPYSRTSDYEGRRIQDIEGGWVLLNHAKYRAQGGDEHRKQMASNRQKRWRERQKEAARQNCETFVDVTDALVDVTDALGDVTRNTKAPYTDADTDTEVYPEITPEITPESTPGNKITPTPPKPPKGGESGFDEFWKAYPKKIGKEAARRAWKKSKPDLDVVKSTLAWQVRSEQWTREGGRFIPNPATWINQGRWDDVRPSASQTMPISTSRPDGPPHDYDDLLNDESVVPYEVKMAYGGRGAKWRNLPEETRRDIKAESDRRAEMARNGLRIEADASEAPSEGDHSGEDVTAPLRAIMDQLAV